MGDLAPLARITTFFQAENDYFAVDPDHRFIGGMLALLDQDVIVEVPESAPHGGTWRGHAGFEALFAAVAAHWTEFEVVFDDSRFHELADGRVLCEGILRGTRRATGQEVAMPLVSFFTFTEAGISHLEHFYKDSGALTPSPGPGASGVEERLARLEDEASIRRTITKYAMSIDAADWDGLVTCFTPEAHFDIPGAPPRRMSASTWVHEFPRAILSGYTRIQHLNVNTTIDIEGEGATCSAYQFAQFYLGGVEHSLAGERGRYDFTLARSQEGWLISGLTLRVWWTEGNPELPALAKRTSMSTMNEDGK